MKEIAIAFFRLGLFAFGGPAAHIGMMEQEFVSRRRWLDRQHFLDLLGATNLIPGPNSTELSMHLGYQRGGWKGLFVAGGAFIFPAFSLTLLAAWAYGRYGTLPDVEPWLYGIKPVAVALIAGAVWKLGKKAIKNRGLGMLAAVAVLGVALGAAEVLVILGGALLWSLGSAARKGRLSSSLVGAIPLLGSLFSPALNPAGIFLVFLKTGAVLFGSGYVLVAYLEADLVDHLGWMSQSELLDAIAIGQLTPGPVLSAATFIGYGLDGFKGALAATAGIFLPSFFFVLITHPIVPRLRGSAAAAAFLDGANVCAVAIMGWVLFVMGRSLAVDLPALALAGLATLAVFRWKRLGPIRLVLLGALLGRLVCLLAG